MARRKSDKPIDAGQKRLAEPFRITVLLEEHMQFHVQDMQAALAEDFPKCDWSGGETLPDLPFDTAGVAAVPIACGRGIGPAVVMGGKGLDIDWTPLLERNRIPLAGDIADRMVTSVAHMDITTGSDGRQLTDRIKAARAATAIAAVFAELPIVTGVMVNWCNRVMPAEAFRQALNPLDEGRIPMTHWVQFLRFSDPAAPDTVSGTTVGLAPFLGYEIEARQSPLDTQATLQAIFAAARAALQEGASFDDGVAPDVGLKDGGDYRMRHMPQGQLGNDTDRWALIHCDSPFRDRKVLGRPTRRARKPSDGPGLLSRIVPFKRGAADIAAE